MKHEFLKTLWMLRFEKIKKAEEDAAWGYLEMSEICEKNLTAKDEAVLLLKQLAQEERMHEKLADELIKICRQNHAECGLL